MPVYEQTYRHYDGPRTVARRWLPIMRMTMRPYWANKRNLFLPLLLCCYMIVSGVLFYIAGQARTLVPKEAQDQLGSVGAAARFPLPGSQYGPPDPVFPVSLLIACDCVAHDASASRYNL
ncbi:MAG: hypothetical protein KatS3mg130_0636 [Candidatus Sumerlaea sp.]|nr:MAG: hypothetical protein KatS3mg130_0636 [Candidatus Sumerlaea sp.]